MKKFRLFFKKELGFPCMEKPPFLYAKDKKHAKQLAKIEFAPVRKHILGYVEVQNNKKKNGRVKATTI